MVKSRICSEKLLYFLKGTELFIEKKKKNDDQGLINNLLFLVDVKNILNTIKKGLKAKIYSLQRRQDFKSEASVVGKSVKEHNIQVHVTVHH